MRFWGWYFACVAIISPLVQFYGMDWLLRRNLLDSGALLILVYLLFLAWLISIVRASTYALWARIVLGMIGAVLLALPPAWAFLSAYGRAFKN